MMMVPCGLCGRDVVFAPTTVQARCFGCGAVITRHRMSSEPDYAQQMREWAEKHGVKPLEDMRREWAPRPIWYNAGDPPVPFDPQRLAEDAKGQFSTPDGTSRDEFYASWAVYDAACENLPPAQQTVQRRAEIVELARWFRL